ncbi:hypothetical protein [Lactiplantibacillus plantarum]|uniref:hypothetical protein n=1 Tax=Lactiplantibacillus plantarum TaxID=1590 RepID=UPI003B50DC1F
MQLKKGKIFRRADASRKLVWKVYDENKDDYFDFIAKQNSQGLIQFIVSSRIMIELIKHLVTKENFRIKEIKFMEDDESLDNDVKELIRDVDNNSGLLIDLLDKLHCLSDDNSIDIKMIHVSKRVDGSSIVMYIQANGIVSIDPSHFNNEGQFITDIIGNMQW